MSNFILRRLLSSLLALGGVILVTFALQHVAPVDPARQYAGPQASAAIVQSVRVQMGLNRPLPSQLVTYVKDFFTGNWGVSLQTKRPVFADFKKAVPYTLEIVVLAMIVTVLVAVPLGVISANKQDRWQDHATRVFAVGLVSVPTFWLALSLQYVVAGKLHLLPLAGTADFTLLITNPLKNVTGFPLVDELVTGNYTLLWNHALHLIMPVVALSGMALGGIQRLTRSSMVDVLHDDYMVAIRSYGLPDRRVLWRYGLKNVTGPVATAVAIYAGYLLVNTFLIETIFNVPGIGAMVATAVSALDYPVIMAMTLFTAVIYIVLNTVADMMLFVDPRVRR
jgi:peptide/nickel transport system permease protein